MQLGTVIKNRYKIIKHIGQGTFSDVYLAKHLLKDTSVVIKFALINNEISMKLLDNEIKIYLFLLKNKMSHIANIKSYGLMNDLKFIIMDYLYMDLKTYFNDNKQKITIHEVNDLMNQTMILIRNMHSMGFLHRDIKPDNFLFNKEGKLCIIDMGLSCRIENVKTSYKHIGTPLFSSYLCHNNNGYLYTKTDDFLSIYYMFFYLCSNFELPWSKIFLKTTYYDKETQQGNKNTIMYLLKKETDYNSYYKTNTNYDTILKFIIQSYENFLYNKNIAFYS